MNLTKLKKGIGVLVCCAAIMGGFSYGGMHTEAALICDHTVLQLETGMTRREYHDSTYHYVEYGDKLSCPRCGYEHWENVYTKNEGRHEFDKDGICRCGYSR